MLTLLLSPAAFALGNNALIYTADTADGDDVPTSTSWITETLRAEGATKVDITSTWPSNVENYRVVVLWAQTSSFSSSETADLGDYLVAGGVLMPVADAYDFDDRPVTVMNNLLDDLGIASAFTASSIDSGCTQTATRVAAHDLTAGVASIGYAYSTAITAGSRATALYEGESGRDLVVVEESVILVADLNALSDACFSSPPGNDDFIANVWNWGGSCETPDADGDGYDSEACGGDDCDDTDPDVNPGEYRYADADGDGYGDPTQREDACSAPADYVDNGNDCDDSDRRVGEGDGPFWEDGDGDGYGDPDAPSGECTDGPGLADNDEDCDDHDEDKNPGATEVCNSEDDDCDGDVDDGATDTSVYYYDGDEDGYGDPEKAEETCDPSDGYVTEGGDCADGDPTVYPGSKEYKETCEGMEGYVPPGGGGRDEDEEEEAACACPLSAAGVLLPPVALLLRRRR